MAFCAKHWRVRIHPDRGRQWSGDVAGEFRHGRKIRRWRPGHGSPLGSCAAENPPRAWASRRHAGPDGEKGRGDSQSHPGDARRRHPADGERSRPVPGGDPFSASSAVPCRMVSNSSRRPTNCRRARDGILLRRHGPRARNNISAFTARTPAACSMRQGKFLRGLSFAGKDVASPLWDLEQSPQCEMRGFWFANHAPDVGYEMMSMPQFRAYLEDIVLWGVNTFAYAPIDFHNWDSSTFSDPAAFERRMKRNFHDVPAIVRDYDLKITVKMFNNNVFADDIAKLGLRKNVKGSDASISKMYCPPAGFACPSDLASRRRLLETREELFKRLPPRRYTRRPRHRFRRLRLPRLPTVRGDVRQADGRIRAAAAQVSPSGEDGNQFLLPHGIRKANRAGLSLRPRPRLGRLCLLRSPSGRRGHGTCSGCRRGSRRTRSTTWPCGLSGASMARCPWFRRACRPVPSRGKGCSRRSRTILARSPIPKAFTKT